MLSHLLSSRLIQAGLAFFVIVVGGSLLYSWHDKRTTEKELAPHDRFLQGINENGARTAETVTDTTQNDAPAQQVGNTVSATPTVGSPQKTRADMPQEPAVSATGVSDMAAEIIAEEEKAEEALSAEERRNREGRERLQNTYSKIRDLIASEGGKIDHTSSLSARVEFFHLQQELFRLFEEGADEIPAGLRFFMNLSKRMSAGGTASGDFSVSEYVNVADFLDAEGDVETANRMRAVAQRALDNGDDILKPEHFEVDP